MIENTASATTTGDAHCEASGNRPRQNRIIPKVPILSRMLTSRTEVPGVLLAAASGSHVCTGHIGALTANATKKPRNSQRSGGSEKGRWRRALGRERGAPRRAV